MGLLSKSNRLMDTFINEGEINSLPKINYTQRNDPFYKKCSDRVNAYFKERQLSKFAGTRMYGKTILLLSLWLGGFALIMTNWFAGLVLIGLQVAWHMVMFLMSVGIAHDGTHHAYSTNERINKLFARVFDYIGINSDMWEYNHILSHHNAPNVPIYDSAIFSLPLFRFHPRAPYRSYHRYQHLYIFVIYALSTLFKLFVLDLFSFNRPRIGFVQVTKRNAGAFLYLLFTKLVVISYTLVLPLVFLDAQAWQVITGFVLGHLLSGVLLGVIFQVTHLHQATTWPEPDAKGNMHNSFACHILATTADFAPGSRFWTWVSGGLNIHVAHHLFPTVSQSHLIPLARIVKEVAAEEGLTYHYYPTVGAALRSHLRTLRQLGQPESIPQQPAAFAVGAISA